MPTPPDPQLLSRRRVLALSGAAAASLGFATTSCGTDADVQATVDTLTTQLSSARRDAVDSSAAIAVFPEYAAALTTVATERSAHADALAAEIDRASGVDPSAAGSSTAPTTTVVLPPPGIETLRENLRGSQRAAADAARNESGYRAGLLGSISAACAVQVGVLLP